jgi:hypothetical protein
MIKLELGKLYKVIFPFTAVSALLGQKYGYSFAAHTGFEEKAKIGIDEVFMVEEDEILMVINVEKPSTRNKKDLPKCYWSEIEYTFLNSKGKTIQTIDPRINFKPEEFFEEIITQSF